MSHNRFSYEWQKYPDIIPEYETQFLRWIIPIKPVFFKKKIILDVGCGTGRNSVWPLRYGAKKIVAFDEDVKIVQIARKNLQEFPNIAINHKSVYELSYKNRFDIVLCIGVLHHLADPQTALNKMHASLKKNGTIILWVYGYEGNEGILIIINIVRKITCRLPLVIVHLLSFVISLPLFVYLKLFPTMHPYFLLLSHFKFWHIRSIIFDQLIPQIANYWRKAEIELLVKKSGFTSISFHHTNRNSWTVIALK